MIAVASREVFPLTRIRAVLDEFWDRECVSPVAIGLPSAGIPVLDVGAELDSLTAVKVLLDVEIVLECEDLPETLVKRGGYSNKNEFLQDLSSKLEAYWTTKTSS